MLTEVAAVDDQALFAALHVDHDLGDRGVGGILHVGVSPGRPWRDFRGRAAGLPGDKARYLVEAHVVEGRSVRELAAAHGVNAG